MKKTRLVTSIFALLCMADIAAADDSCKDAAAANAVMKTFEADLNAITENRKVHEKKLEDEIRAATDTMISNKKLSKQKQVEFLASQLSNDEFATLEAQKAPLLQQYMLALQDMIKYQEKGDDINTCAAMVKSKNILETIGRVNDQQYAVLLKRVLAQ